MRAPAAAAAASTSRAITPAPARSASHDQRLTGQLSERRHPVGRPDQPPTSPRSSGEHDATAARGSAPSPSSAPGQDPTPRVHGPGPPGCRRTVMGVPRLSPQPPSAVTILAVAHISAHFPAVVGDSLPDPRPGQ